MSARYFTYADLLARNACLFGSQPALIWKGLAVTHAELHMRTCALAAGLRAAGVRSGDRLALLAGNRVEILELLGAVAWLGACLVPINFRSSADEVGHILSDCAPRMLFVSREYAALADSLTTDTLIVDLDETQEDGAFSTLYRTHDNMIQHGTANAIPGDDAALVMIYTAATDGKARGAVLTHRGLISTAMQMQATWQLSVTDRGIGVLPLFHVAGLGIALAVQVAGGALLLEEQFDADRVVELANVHDGSVMSCFPPMLDAILDSSERSGRTLQALRVVSGIESEESIGRLHAAVPGAHFWSAYGQTETTGVISLSPYDERPGSAGRPLPLCLIRIVDDAGEDMAIGALGDIVVRGPAVFAGYWNQADGRCRSLTDEWHRTGDLGSLDEEGYLWFRGRSEHKSLIKTGGENVYPTEVEAVLKTHPAVADASVYGVADTRWGEAVMALCVLHSGAAVSVEELDDYVGSRLARFKRPRSIKFVDRIPRTASGQLDRSALDGFSNSGLLAD